MLAFAAIFAGVIVLLSGPMSAVVQLCPQAGGTIAISLMPAAGASGSDVGISGALLEPSCRNEASLATTYTQSLTCAPDSGTCTVSFDGLAPGLWVHRISVSSGESLGQVQARRSLVLDSSAGSHQIPWPLFRSVHTVSNLDDSPECERCLRRALTLAQDAPKPTLVIYEATVAGEVVLSDALPEISANEITLDGLDGDGVAHRRTINANGLSRSALLITGANNHIIGIRITNVGGDADMLLLEGPRANNNRIESVQIIGRALEVCERLGRRGCVVNRECAVPSRLTPRGDCGDDGVAVRNDAGIEGPNALIDLDISGAFDKGVKVSEGGFARIERSWIHDNTDGGIQATIGGQVTVLHSVAENNSASAGANGLAANGPRPRTNDPARITTRGNLIRNNALRGISVRSRSLAILRDDFLCGNGTFNSEAGFGLALLEAADASADVDARGLGIVRNVDGGVLIMGDATGTFGNPGREGRNAFAFNGVSGALNGAPNFRNFSTREIAARGNYWEHCGPTWKCDVPRVVASDLHTPGATVRTDPFLATPQHRRPVITEIEPPFARNGDLIRIYGEHFDAVTQARDNHVCTGPGRPCTGSDANCVYIDRQAVEIVAATPTMLVARMPFTCVTPVRLVARTRRSRGMARTTYCTLDPPAP